MTVVSSFCPGVGVENVRHGFKCEAAKEQHAVRVSRGAFVLGVELGYSQGINGRPRSGLIDRAEAFRETGWRTVKN